MTATAWNLSTDPEYLRVRSLILLFYTKATRRAYVDGKLTEDQKDDIQDAFVAWFADILPAPSKKYSNEVRLFFSVLYIRKCKEEATRVEIGGKTVPRRRNSISGDGTVRFPGWTDADPEDDPVEGRGFADPFGTSPDPAIDARILLHESGLSPREKRVVRLHYLERETLAEISGTLGIGLESVREYRRRAIKKIRSLVPQRG